MDIATDLAWHFALVGTPNSGKTALFNALTGNRQKVANYPGVTVERKTGALKTPSGRCVTMIDLPGTYSLRARSPDEEITRDVVLGRLKSETPPDLASLLERIDGSVKRALDRVPAVYLGAFCMSVIDDLPSAEIGRRAAQLALSLLENPPKRPKQIVLTPDLVMTLTTAPAL